MSTGSAATAATTFATDIPPRLDRLPWSRWHFRVAAALGITFLLDGLEGGVGGSLAGALESTATLHLTEAQLGIASTGYLLGTVLGALVFGYLADRFGRKTLFTATLVLYVCSTAATSLSWNLASFTLCRLLTGAGIGGEYTAINSTIDELIPARVRGRVNLFIGSTFWIGVILGSLVSVGFLSETAFGLHYGWRIAFLSGLPIAAVVLYARRHLPESPRWLLTHGRPEDAETVTRAIETELRKTGHQLAPVNRTVQMQHLTESTFRHLGVLFTPRFRTRAAVCLVLTMAQSFFYNTVFFSATLVLLRFYRVSAAHAGVLFLPLAVSNFIGPLVLGRLFDTVGRRIMIAASFLTTAVVFAVSDFLFLAHRLTAFGQGAWWAAAFFFAAAAGGSAYLTTSELFPQNIRASAIAIFYAVGTLLAGVLGPTIFGALLHRGSRVPIFYGFLVSAAAMAAAALVQAIWGTAAEGKTLEEIC